MSRLGGGGNHGVDTPAASGCVVSEEWDPRRATACRFSFHGPPPGNGGPPGRRGFSGDALPHTHEPPVHHTVNAGTAAGVGMGLWSSSIGDFCLGAATSPCFRGGAPTRRRPSPGSRLVREASYSRDHGFVRTRGLHNSALQRGASLFAVTPQGREQAQSMYCVGASVRRSRTPRPTRASAVQWCSHRWSLFLLPVPMGSHPPVLLH